MIRERIKTLHMTFTDEQRTRLYSLLVKVPHKSLSISVLHDTITINDRDHNILETLTDILLPMVIEQRPNEWVSAEDRAVEFYTDCFAYKRVHPIDWLYKELFENSEYAGNSGSGQSAGTDLVEDFIEKWNNDPAHIAAGIMALKVLNDKVNKLSKPSETNYRSKS